MSRGALLETTLYLLAGLSFLVGFGLPEPTTPRFILRDQKAASVLRVVTWNVGGSGRDGEWGNPLDDENLQHVVDVIRELDPDLCFLQEVRIGLQARRIHEALGDGWSLELAPPHFGRRILALAQRGQLRSKSLDSASRLSLGVLYSPENRAPFLAAGLHADATSAESRNAEIGAVASFLAAAEVPALLVGDLNLDLDLGKRRDLFTDNEYLDVETYNFVVSHFRDAGRGTGSTAEPDRRLDYIFVDEQAFEVVSAGPLKNRRTGNMDHDPVVADLIRN